MELTTKRRRSGFDEETTHPPKLPKTNDPDRRKKRLTHKHYTVGWLCALAIERAAAEAMLHDTHERLPNRPNDSNTYTLGNIGPHNVVIACLPSGHYGLVNAALVANNMTWSFPSIQTKLMVGIGGGAPSRVDIRLGDVVVGNKVLQCDFGKITSQGLCRTSTPVRPPQSIMTAVAALEARHQLGESNMSEILSCMLHKHPSIKHYSHPVLEDRLFCSRYEHRQNDMPNCDGCDLSQLVSRPDRPNTHPRVHYGIIASGNQVIKYAKARDDWSDSDDAICFEMEAAGLIDHFQCLVIRGICDYADSHKNKEWQTYAAGTAAAYASELVSTMDMTHIDEALSPIVREPSADQQSAQIKLSTEQREALLESLRFDQIDARRHTIKKAHSKTCKWLLKKDQYLQWLDPKEFHKHRGFLWIKGKPGTGKSTVMKFALQNAQRTKKHHNVINFFFNARGDDLEKSTTGMYRSLLVQILDMFPDQLHILDTFGNYITQSQKWRIEILKELFEQVMQGLQGIPVTCYIDALDECDEDQIRDMISFFESIGEDAISTEINLSICFSSRHYPHITMNHGLELILEGQEGHHQDITDYIKSELKIGQSHLAGNLRAEVQEKASGIFIWVALVVDILNKEFDRGRIHALRTRLREIPADLHELFRDILTRDSHNKDELLLCVQWILFARTPMKPEQLYYAILSDTRTSEDLPAYDDISQEDIERFLLDSSKGLAEVTKSKTSTVQFIHESVRDFLLKDKGIVKIWPELEENFQGKSHEQLKSCCLRYNRQTVSSMDLSFELLSVSSAKSKKQNDTIQIMYPFLEYTIPNIFFHADKATSYGISQNHFISDFDLDNWIRLQNLQEKHEVRRYKPGTRLLYILAEANCPQLIRSYSSGKSCLDVKKERFGCPLLAAIVNNSPDVIDAFHQSLAVEFCNQEPAQGQDHRYNKVNYDLHFKPNEDFTVSRFRFSNKKPVIWYLLKHGSFQELILLLIRKLDFVMHLKNRFEGKCAVSFSAQNGHTELLRILLENHEFDPDSKDNSGQTPLSWAVERGHKEIVQILLNTGQVDLNFKDSLGQTLLSQAVNGGHKEIVQILLNTGQVDLRFKDNLGQTPLAWAASNGYKEIVLILLNIGQVNPDSKDSSGQTPLSRAARNGHKEIVLILLNTGQVDPDSRDNLGQTPLAWAANNGHIDVALIIKDRLSSYWFV